MAGSILSSVGFCFMLSSAALVSAFPPFRHVEAFGRSFLFMPSSFPPWLRVSGPFLSVPYRRRRRRQVYSLEVSAVAAADPDSLSRPTDLGAKEREGEIEERFRGERKEKERETEQDIARRGE